jgi:hypothetical protein
MCVTGAKAVVTSGMIMGPRIASKTGSTAVKAAATSA